jgi:hypothetical protein
MAFDPCREWLGIDAVDLTDPRKVLGLLPGEPTAAEVQVAAAERLATLARATPGPFAKAHAALVARVEEARDRLLADAGGVAPPPPPPPPAPAVASATSILPPPADSLDPSVEAVGIPPGPVVSRRSTASRRQRDAGGGGLLAGSIALLAAAVAVLAFFVVQFGQFGGRTVATRPETVVTVVKKGNDPPPARPAPSPAPSEPKTPEPTGRINEPPDAPPEQPSEPEGRGTDDAGGPPMEASSEPDRNAEREAEEARRRAEQAQKKEEQRKLEEQQKQEQQRMLDEERRADERARARMAEAVEKQLREAYAAIQRGEFDTAQRAIAAAANQVGDDVTAATRVQNWDLFARYAREFPGYRERAFAAANAGREYEVGGKKFSVVEITPELFVYRLSGKNERVPRDAVDPQITLAIVEAWFAADGRAANHLFLGAHWLSLSPPDTRRARAEWQIAGDGGENIAPLMALLDDPVIRQAGR